MTSSRIARARRRANTGSSAPQLETRNGEVLIEPEDVRALRCHHHGKTYRVRVGNGARSEPLEPLARRLMVAGRGEMNRNGRARVDRLNRAQRWLVPRAKQRQSMRLGDDEIRRHEWNVLFDCGPKCAIRRCVMLVAAAAQRDPRPAIDE